MDGVKKNKFEVDLITRLFLVFFLALLLDYFTHPQVLWGKATFNSPTTATLSMDRIQAAINPGEIALKFSESLGFNFQKIDDLLDAPSGKNTLLCLKNENKLSLYGREVDLPLVSDREIGAMQINAGDLKIYAGAKAETCEPVTRSQFDNVFSTTTSIFLRGPDSQKTEVIKELSSFIPIKAIQIKSNGTFVDVFVNLKGEIDTTDSYISAKPINIKVFFAKEIIRFFFYLLIIVIILPNLIASYRFIRGEK